MPKATLEYTLPEEESDFIRACKGSQAISALWDIDNYIRNKLKYEECDEKTIKELESIRALIPSEMLEL